jgi:hypothetical protein
MYNSTGCLVPVHIPSHAAAHPEVSLPTPDSISSHARFMDQGYAALGVSPKEVTTLEGTATQPANLHTKQ